MTSRNVPVLATLVFLFAVRLSAAADNSSLLLLDHAWPDVASRRVSEIGRGVGVVFSPDLSVADNCRFYESLGFACFQDADWTNILAQIHIFNLLNPGR